MKKLLIIAMLILYSCASGDDGLDCQSFLINPPDGPPYWTDICTDTDGTVIHDPVYEEAYREGRR
jgi:hypothetical protein